MTATANRHDAGTAYTSPEFAAEIAHHALEHLVYEPGPHNEEDESNWQIKPPDEILELRVCDPAVGSGAILVAAVRFLADKLVESHHEHGGLTARDLETAAADPMVTDPQVQARRDVVAQCIYAVDRDPMAVEMAKLSLWLVTMANGRPFTFLDHAIKCGDSLLGVTSLDQLRRLHLEEGMGTQIGLDLDRGRAEGLGGYFETIDERIHKALALAELVTDGDVVDVRDARQRIELNAETERVLSDLKLVADAITATCYLTSSGRDGAAQAALARDVLPLVSDFPANRAALAAISASRPSDAPDSLSFLHWPLEFPEVFRLGGFDAIVANPPFQGGKKLKAAVGKSYRDYIVRYCANGDSGSADLVAYFFRRAAVLAKSFGLIATNTVYQGVTRKVATGALVSGDTEATIYRADSSAKWPGRDAVYVPRVWWDRHGKARWATRPLVDGVVVNGVTSDLYPLRGPEYRPMPIPANSGVAHIGQLINGDGFLVPPATARRWIEEDEANADVLQPFVNGEFLNASLAKRANVQHGT